MSEHYEVQQALALFFKGINENDASIIPLTPDVVISGPMMPERKSGEAEVRQYLSEIAPFIASVTPKESLIEGGGAAVIVTFEMLNGTVIEGAEFFRVRDGLICQDQVFFDTRVLFKGTH
ncbi:MAG: nuclear transport factor 2 family protein [Xanthomonadales bacterium]|nr:nuclear transport factor 2 family protein [Gammaproteobacteria bacterium]MBT8055074.1 nuclear transport factor 2 family protein [Gammaproteobacteria bacterium]NND57322.1 nuclear transport factor 2 family protein [Xanthomonadales bacterium]NNK51777.1 nuclear transport factor 2 family protein [Xanthomonadales bacterium]